MGNIEGLQIDFAKITRGVQAIDVKNIISSSSKYTLTQIQNALQNKDLKTLINISNYFYITNGYYRRLIHAVTDMHTYRYMYVKKNIGNSTKLKRATIQDKAKETFDRYVMNANIEQVNRYITFITFLNGTFYGYEIHNDTEVTLQELPSQYCRTRSKEDDNYVIEMDFKFFDEIRDTADKIRVFESLPDFFLKEYNTYKSSKEKDANWRMIPSDVGRCHRIDDSGIPFFSAVFPEIISMQEYKDIDLTKNKLQLYRILTQKLPLDKATGKPLVTGDEAHVIHENAKKMVDGELVDIITTPCDIESIDLSNKGDTIDDVLDNSVNSFYNSTGVNRLLLASSKNPTSAGLAASIALDEALVEPLLLQYQNWYNCKFRRIINNPNIVYVFLFLGITINNEKDKIAQYLSMAQSGYSKYMPMVAMGVPQHLVKDLILMEEEDGLRDLLIPLQTSFTQSGNAESGRPIDDSSENDTTIRQKDKGTKESRSNSTE